MAGSVFDNLLLHFMAMPQSFLLLGDTALGLPPFGFFDFFANALLLLLKFCLTSSSNLVFLQHLQREILSELNFLSRSFLFLGALLGCLFCLDSCKISLSLLLVFVGTLSHGGLHPGGHNDLLLLALLHLEKCFLALLFLLLKSFQELSLMLLVHFHLFR